MMTVGRAHYFLWLTGLLAAGAVIVAVDPWQASPASEETDDRYLTKAIRADYPGFIGQARELGAATAKLDREYRQGDENERKKREEEWSAQQTKDDLARESAWRAAPISNCGDFGSAPGPQLCIDIEGPRSREFGTPVVYRVRWWNLPKDAYVRVWAVNAAPAGERWKYLGAQGAISVSGLGRSERGDERLSWDGRSNACAPADAPMLCDRGQIGTYILRAAILTGSDPFHVGWPVLNPAPVAYRLRAETSSFALTGSPQLDNFAPIAEAVGKALPRAIRGRGSPSLELGPWEKTLSGYCSRLALKPPLAGTVRTCFPRSRIDDFGIALRREDISVESDAHLAPGIMRMEDAKARAIAYGILMTGKRATYPAYPGESDLMRKLHRDPKTYHGGYQQLRDDARDAGLSFVDVNQPYPSFRTDGSSSWWLITFNLGIQTIDGPRVANLGRVAVRVDHDGNVCRVEQQGVDRSRSGPEREVYSACVPGSRKSIEI